MGMVTSGGCVSTMKPATKPKTEPGDDTTAGTVVRFSSGGGGDVTLAAGLLEMMMTDSRDGEGSTLPARSTPETLSVTSPCWASVTLTTPLTAG